MDGTIYFGADKLYALNSDGSLRWAHSAPETNPGAEYFNSPVIGPDGVVYASKTNGPGLHAIEPNGQRRWLVTGTFGNYGLGPVLGPNGRIYLRSEFGVVTGINPDGAALWNRSVNTVYSSSAVSSGGDFYFGTGVGNGNGLLRRES